jgi:hypothetical protein
LIELAILHLYLLALELLVVLKEALQHQQSVPEGPGNGWES